MNKAIVYYRKDPSWMATSPLAPPDIDGPAALVEVHRVYLEPMEGLKALVDNDNTTLERIWGLMQGIEKGDLVDRLSIRSMMVGDIVTIGYAGWQVEALGWKKIRPSWLAEGSEVAPPHAFPELMSCREESSKEDATSQS